MKDQESEQNSESHRSRPTKRANAGCAVGGLLIGCLGVPVIFSLAALIVAYILSGSLREESLEKLGQWVGSTAVWLGIIGAFAGYYLGGKYGSRKR